MIVIDADDFCEGNAKLDIMEALHYETGMLFNLFTVVGLCSIEFLTRVKQISYIDMIPHGWLHGSSRECQWWSYKEACDYLKKIEVFNLTKGFKAPGWQISDGMYKTLFEHGYWVADQHYNDNRRPEGLKVFYHQDEHHFHIGHMGGYNSNEIELHIDRLLQVKGDFKFIKNIL